MPLGELSVRNAKPKDKPYKLIDGEGLHLLVQKNGSRLWQMRYRFSGKEKLLSFGRYPDVSLAAARQRRYEARQQIANEVDPGAEKKAAKAVAADTFEQIARLWHANRKDALDPAHEQRVLSRLERDVFPEIGSRSITSITAPEILLLIRKVEARGALDISRRVRQMIGQVYRFAISSGFASADPSSSLADAMKPRPKVQHMSKVPMQDLPELLSKIANYDGEAPRRRIVTKSAIWFTLLTWVRTKEARFAVKSEFEDLDGPEPLWRIPAGRMKKDREHLVPLSRQAAALAREMIAASDSEFVFPGDKPQKPLSENTMIFALYRMGYIGRQTIHGFRGLASTWANEALTPDCDPRMPVRRYHEDWVEMQLSHAEDNEVRGAYNSAEYIFPRRQMLQDWADRLDAELAVGRMFE